MIEEFEITIPPSIPFKSFKWRWAVTTPSEGLNRKDILFGVLKVLVKHNGKAHATQEFRNDLIELENSISDSKISLSKNKDKEGNPRPLGKNIIENSGQYWKALGLINTTTNGTIEVSDLGLSIVNNNLSDIDFIKKEIKLFTLPNKIIEDQSTINLFKSHNIEIKPLELLIKIYAEMTNILKSPTSWYLTVQELANIIVPLSVNKNIGIDFYIEHIIKYRQNSTDYNYWPKCFPEANDMRMIREYLLFLKNFNALNELEIKGEDSRFYVNEMTIELIKEFKQISKNSQIKNDEKHNFGAYDYKNMLLKGVPGTGKSHKIDEIIENNLNIINTKNKLRINIHAASSNSDLIQGIGINSDGGNIKYLEKQGIILNFIINAIMNPDEPFALVLEEIQENSLNELVGDLIYLLEESKRTDIRKEIDDAELTLSDYKDYQDLLDKLIEKNPKINHIQIPYLIESESKFRNFVLPDNLYLFLTSNYRDDKKVIEDNLLRRIATFEIFPKYKDILGEHFKSEEVSKFLRQLNDSILNQFKDREVHPDRFLIGHANWLKVETEKKFYESLLKVIIEFQDIKELYYSDVHDILKGIENYPLFLEEEMDNKIKSAERYFDIIELLQDKIFND